VDVFLTNLGTVCTA